MKYIRFSNQDENFFKCLVCKENFSGDKNIVSNVQVKNEAIFLEDYGFICLGCLHKIAVVCSKNKTWKVLRKRF